jgi:hypothetical protein
MTHPANRVGEAGVQRAPTCHKARRKINKGAWALSAGPIRRAQSSQFGAVAVRSMLDLTVDHIGGSEQLMVVPATRLAHTDYPVLAVAVPPGDRAPSSLRSSPVACDS